MRQVSILIAFLVAGFLTGACNKNKPEKAAGVPGDHLDLYAVLDLFKSSNSIENFEKSLNSKSTGINNIDLNGDEKVDYIRVIDLRDGDAHAITLRIPVTSEESQDIAVIEIEKTGDKTASIQIIGDEDMYGKDVIIEPKDEDSKAGFIYASPIAVNVWLWPSVTYIYSPAYVVWVSPYYYDYYPVYWSPWPPVAYEVYYPIVYTYHSNYISYNKHRFKHAHELYYPNRVSSGFVMTRHKNGDFHGGKQVRYKGNYPKGNDGHGGNNGKHDNSFDGGKDKDGHQKNGQSNERKGNDPKGGQYNKGGQDKGDNHKVQDHSKKDGGNSKVSPPKGSNQKSQGGNSPKGGGGNKGGGNKGGGGKK